MWLTAWSGRGVITTIFNVAPAGCVATAASGRALRFKKDGITNESSGASGSHKESAEVRSQATDADAAETQEEPEEEEQALPSLVTQALLYSLFCVFLAGVVIISAPSVRPVKFLLFGVFFLQTAENWVKVVRKHRGESIRQPPPLLLRLLFLAQFLTLAYLLAVELPSLPGENPLRPLLYLGAAGFVAAGFYIWKVWREQEQK